MLRCIIFCSFEQQINFLIKAMMSYTHFKLRFYRCYLTPYAVTSSFKIKQFPVRQFISSLIDYHIKQIFISKHIFRIVVSEWFGLAIWNSRSRLCKTVKTFWLEMIHEFIKDHHEFCSSVVEENDCKFANFGRYFVYDSTAVYITSPGSVILIQGWF